jgi:AraC family transcriptional regulator of adaptative response/methylated-DNA-[protein]-cysteine methyltransferase
MPTLMKQWSTSERRWQAVQARAAEADGAFFFAVKTTGVFCRPSCRSRAPRRQNVEFFDSAALALRAGYRACRRCHPTTPAVDAQASALVRACRALEQVDAATVASIAAQVGWSVFHFQRVFKQRLGVTPGAYRRGVLADRARQALASGSRVSDAVYEAGYSSTSRFYEGVGQQLGMRPRSAQAGAAGERIDFCLTGTSLGPVLIGWTARGVCHVGFEETEAALEARFPQAQLREVLRGPWCAVVTRIIEGAPAQVPLDLRGTVFQVRVWETLRQISAGEKRSYSQVAEAMGTPSSVRAVARACALNSLAVLVPCHRVVRANQALGGYRWGLERKRALLAREG